jgi:hypothetical protein
VLREETAKVLPFRDAALRRPIDVVAWINTHAPLAGKSAEFDNVIPLARASRLGDCGTWFGGPPEGEAA